MHISLAGVAVAVIAVFLAYFMGYASGVALGRDEGFSTGKREGSREGSIRAYAVGFDRGKRARDDDDDDDDEDDEGDEIGGSANLGFAILAVAAGVFGVLWLTSHTPTTPVEYRGVSTLPVVDSDDIAGLTRPSVDPNSQSVVQRPPSYSPPQQTVVLPKVNRSLPTATPMPADGLTPVYYTPSEFERGREFPHPPPAFRRP